MRNEEFKAWLQQRFPGSKSTVNNRLSNCNNVEKHYGDLDIYFAKDRCNSIIEELNYSTEDGRAKKTQRHKVPIKGNIVTGSATLKLAVKLYVEFRDFQNEEDNSESFSIEDIIPTGNNIGSIILNQLWNQLKDFKFDKKKHKDVAILQIEITEYLMEKFKLISWKMEYKPLINAKDSIDIYGLSEDGDFKIVIELDAHRADQVAKKFVSRSALFVNDNVIYLSVCYPGTKKMNKNECTKYFKYCSILSNALTGTSKNSKLYGGLILG